MSRCLMSWSIHLSLATLLLAACSDSTPPGLTPCAADADCPDAWQCLGGYCQQGCVTSTDCSGDAVCVSGVCLEPCEQSADCSEGFVCEGGYCRPGEPPDGGDDGDGGPDPCVDQDQDGFGNNCPRGDDCDDSDRLINPDAPEACDDGVDNDCDGQIDEADCGCEAGQSRACYTGPDGTEGQGRCRPGFSTCGADRSWGDCLGEALPADETCDGRDNDCDGETDEGLLNRCGQCAPPDDQLVEICGNGLDDDCDGQIDESCSCDPDCQCDEPGSGGECTCHPPVGQPCYAGPPDTLGFGICRGGTHDCQAQPDGSWAWGACEGQVLPGEECAGDAANGTDDDCDGVIDEDCLADGDGDGYSPPDDCDDSDADVHPGAPEVCDGRDQDCNGLADEGVTNACGTCGPVPEESCGDGVDNDCDGDVDEGCGGCIGSETRPCYSGPGGTPGQGACTWGEQVCDGEFWGACVGSVGPSPEACDGLDDDCDGETDEQWASGSNACGYCQGDEICDGADNDCDGFTDEGLRNACGDCLPVPQEAICDGLDDDCDGLTDEGLLTACGTCPGLPCYEVEWDQPGDCEAQHRECNGTEPDPSDPDAVTLGQGVVQAPFIFIAVNGKDEVAKLDTETGEKVWQVPSHGDDPSRTAVALDFSVWVGNRGSGSIWDPDYSNGVHLGADGSLICRVDTPGRTRGVAIDGDGNVWFGTWDGQTVYKVHGADVNDADCAAPPCCRVLDSINVGTSIYGLAVDGNGFLWSASGTSHSHTTDNAIRLNTQTGAFTLVSNPSWYGIAVSPVDGRIWYGNWWGTGCVHSILPDPPHTVFNTSVCGGHITAVTVDLDGFVWASSHDLNTLYKIDPNSGAVVCSTPVPMVGPGATDARGVAIDAAGKVWVANRLGGYANRFLSDCSHDGTFEIDDGAGTYTYSDMTGMQLRTVTTREGHWIQNFDSGYASPSWHSATWEASVPANTSVQVSFVAAASEAELTSSPSPVCGPFDQSPADLAACPGLQGLRWLSADVALSTTQDGVRPSFSNLRIFWSR